MNQDNLIKSGVKEFSKPIPGTRNKIVANIRWNDECKNGHNTFAITGEIIDAIKERGLLCGAIHHELSQYFPELQKYFKWHLAGPGGPCHYVANSICWADAGNLDHARRCAIWPDAQLSDFTEDALNARLPELMKEFASDLAELGFAF